MKKLFLLPILFLYSFLLFAQYQVGLIPRVSADKSISAKINYTEIEITYGSPKVNGRSIWGELIAFDQVWRAGANNATTIEFSDDVIFLDNKLPKGKYSLFIIPRASKPWSIIFNKVHKQWGAFDYDAQQNILQLEIDPNEHPFTEELNYEISNQGLGNGILNFTWEKKLISIPFSTSFLDRLKKEVTDRSEKSPEHLKFIPYLQASQELINNSDEVALAEEWINKALTLYQKDSEWNEQFFPKIYLERHLQWTKAKILARRGDIKEALRIIEQLKKGNDKYTFYNYMGKRDRIDEYEASWLISQKQN